MSSCTNLQLLLDHLGKLPTKISSKKLTFSYLFICNPIRSWHQQFFCQIDWVVFPQPFAKYWRMSNWVIISPKGFAVKKMFKHTSLSTGASREPPKPIQWRSWTLYCDVGSWSFLLCIAQVGDEKMWVFCLGMLGIYVQDVEDTKSISGKLISVDGSEIRREKPPGMHNKPCMGSTNLNWWTPVLNVYLPRRCKCEKCVKNKIQRLSWHQLFRVVDWLLVTNVFVVWHAGMGAHPSCENIVIQNT